MNNTEFKIENERENVLLINDISLGRYMITL